MDGCQKSIGTCYNITGECIYLPFGKLSHNYGKSPCLMGKLTISMAIFNSKLLVYQRVLKANATKKNMDGLGGNLKKT
jgi:hypothetical protein